MAVVCQCIRCISAGGKHRGGSIVHLQPGRDAGSGRVPAFSPPLSSWDREVGDASGCLCPSSEVPKGGKLQQQTPEVHTTILGHRCSTVVPCGV